MKATRRRRTTTILAGSVVACAATLIATAAVLPPGGSVGLPGTVPAGGVIWDMVRPYEIVSGGGTVIFGGDMHERVLMQGDGTLVFEWRLENSLVNAPTWVVESSVIDYAGLFTDVDWDPAGPAGKAPSMAMRSGDGSEITYDFSGDPVHETEESRYFYSDTNALMYGEVGRITIRVNTGESVTIPTMGPIVDDTPPEAMITDPAPLECVCDPATISGIADDPQTFDNYTLEYREISNPTWTLITQSFTPVPSPGGVLAVWSTTGLPQGYYFLRLTVENTLGDTTIDTTIVWVDQQFDTLTFAGPQTGDVVGGNVCPNGTINDHCAEQYTLEYSPDGVNYFDIDPMTPIYNGPKINQSFGVWDSTLVPDGPYRLRVTADDPCGHVAMAEHEIIVDNTPPTVEITDPLNCECVEGIVNVMGTADDANLASWVLQYSGGGNNNWVTISSGNMPVIGGSLGLWDTTALQNCPYTLRLVASDSAYLNCNGAIHHISEYMVTVNVGACQGCPGDVDHSGTVDVVDLLALLAGWGPCP